MTRKEAISWLTRLYVRADFTDEYGDMEDKNPYEEALDMAINSLERDEKYAELRKRFQEVMMKENMFSINSRDFEDNFFDNEAESEDKE